MPAVPLRWVLMRDPKEEFVTQALLCTDLDAQLERIISWFVRRWQMECTFQEVRQRLGFETLKALVTDSPYRGDCPSAFGAVLVGHADCSPAKGTDLERRAAGGLVREGPSDLLRRFILALVRRRLWVQEATFCGSPADTETVKVPQALMERLTDAVCYAA